MFNCAIYPGFFAFYVVAVKMHVKINAPIATEKQSFGIMLLKSID